VRTFCYFNSCSRLYNNDNKKANKDVTGDGSQTVTATNHEMMCRQAGRQELCRFVLQPTPDKEKFQATSDIGTGECDPWDSPRGHYITTQFPPHNQITSGSLLAYINM
jgi:hypothetical protein